MASLIKNQILKHLSKFAKNLTVDQINVEVLKGKGALQNIELNECVLTEVLELPSWLRVQKATCNSIAVKIPWTSLKTIPVKLYIDEIRVEMVMSSDLRQNRSATDSPSTPYSSADYTGSAAYNFANRVVEGMSLFINTVEVFFTSEKFGGSFMLSRLCVESRTPTWKEAGDLHQTRIRDAQLQQVLVFKQVSWQLLRIEASNISLSNAASVPGSGGQSSPTGGYNINAPLRLITNQGQCRITMKKSTVDGSLIAGRLQLILGDILWVATLPQVRSAINFYMYLMEMIQKAAELNKVQKAEKLLQQADLAHVTAKNSAMGSKLAPPQQTTRSGGVSHTFHHFDVVETSYHFYGARIDLHICDEPSEDSGSPKESSANDGALQLTLQKLSVDFYPYHLAAGDRSSWIYYKEKTCREWILSSLDSYYELFSSKLDPKRREHFRNEWPRLMAQCCVVRLDDITIHCVTKAGDKGSREKLLSCDREVLKLPDDMPVLHAEFSDYYYASDRCEHLPIPAGNTHVQWNPIRVFLDYKTLRWISYVYLDICNTLGLKSSSFEAVPHHDVHIQALMPRLIIPVDTSNPDLSPRIKPSSDPRPDCLIVQTANVVLDNTLIGSNSRSRSALKRYVSQLQDFPLFGTNNDEFSVGNTRIAPLPMRTEAFRNYLTTLCELEQAQMPLFDQSIKSASTDQGDANPKSIDCASTDIWTAILSPLWIDFTGPNMNRYPRPMPFVSDIPITAWLVPNIYSDSKCDSEAAMCTVLLKLDGALKLLMDLDQYVFLYRVMMDLSRLMQVLMDDAKRITDTITNNSGVDDKAMTGLSLCVACLGPAVDLALLLPSTSAVVEEANISEQAVSRSSSDISSSVLGANSAYPIAGPSSEFSNAQQTQQGALPGSFRDHFLSGGLTPDIDIAAIDIAVGAVAIDDAISVMTDVSDVEDSDAFVQIDSPDLSPYDDIFQSQYPPRQGQANQRSGRRTIEAVEAYEEEAVRLWTHNKTAALIDLTTRALQRKVSVLNFRLRQCQVAFALAGEEGRLTVLAPVIDTEEQQDVTLEEAHKLLNTKVPITAALSSPMVNTPSIGQFPVEVRLGFRDAADPGYLDMDLRNLELSFKNENLVPLSAFLQAELPSPPALTVDGEIDEVAMKLRIRVTDSTILVAYPDPVEPVRLRVESVWVLRSKGSELQIQTLKAPGANDTEEKESRKVAELERENAELRQKLAEAKELVQKLAKHNFNMAL